MSSKRQDLAQVVSSREGADTKQLAREIAAYLLQTRQTASLESLLRDVMAYRETNGQVEAAVSTAHDLPPELLNEIEQLIKAKKPNAKSVSVYTKHDPAVVGGLKISLANEQLDLTIRAKLDTFKRLTTEGANNL